MDDRVVDSRESREGEIIRRRRECTACGRRFTSYETIEEIPYMLYHRRHPRVAERAARKRELEAFPNGEAADRPEERIH